MYNIIKGILDEKFIETEKPAKILSLAMKSKKNCILFGPAGHGKSEMVKEVVDNYYPEEEVFIQSFGEGMDEARLFGGLDMKALKEDNVIQYNPERSFLNHRVAIFEELFDAPAVVLLALKDTLTAKELRNGAQKHAMRTETIIALTNHNPAEISNLGPAAHALIERFPLQLNVEWEEYTEEVFINLFNKVKPRAGVIMKSNLAELIAQVHQGGGFISPRSAIHALETIMDNEEKGDKAFLALEFIPGFESCLDDIRNMLRTKRKKRKSESELNEIENKMREITSKLELNSCPIESLKAAKRLTQLDNKLEELAVPDSLIETRSSLRGTIQHSCHMAKEQSLLLTPNEEQNDI